MDATVSNSSDGPSGKSPSNVQTNVKISCAECRRSKLKCDRSVPCESCIRRGCADICPTGTMKATKGNKVLQARSERLAERVKSQAARIAELERALALAQVQSGGGGAINALPPMASGQLLNSQQPQNIYDSAVDELSDSLGSISFGASGQARYHGQTTSSEYFRDLLEPRDSETWESSDSEYADLPGELVELVVAFPLGLRGCAYRKQMFVSFLPSRERALAVADIYYEHIAWMYEPITREDLVTTIIDPIYATTGVVDLSRIHSHLLSVFFGILASGVLYDDHPAAPHFQKQYYALARAALSLDPIWQEATTATVQALFVLMRYTYRVDRTSNEYRWILGGICTRVAGIIGLQRESARWGLDSAEIQRRRSVAWDLYRHEAWTGIVNGRPPSVSIRFGDCRFSYDPEERTAGAYTEWHSWKHSYAAHCLSVSVDFVFARQQSYSELLKVDKIIRQFPVPPELQAPTHASDTERSWSPDPRKAMQQYCVLCERESNLMYIHRSFSTQAIREASNNPLTHKFAPSVLATYRSACRLITSLKCLYPLHPIHTGRSWFFWSGVFSSCIILGTLVVDSPGCTLARHALVEIDLAVPFYEEGSRECRAPGTLDALQKLQRRAHAAFSGFQLGALNAASSRGSPDMPDELEVLGGRGHIIKRTASDVPPAPGDFPNFDAMMSDPQISLSDIQDFLQDYAWPGSTSIDDLLPEAALRGGSWQPEDNGPLDMPFIVPDISLPSEHETANTQE
ncbi:hypothetical protein PLICRDRAFT_38690 [Plicaturopsis crispa FD-325 SS-3]|nr:hypothetical protein PLICRDRAFT_38690 [Plicaturopsis crispa FD-325 SS-3]